MSKFLDKAPDIKDVEIQSRLNKLHLRNKRFNRGNNNNFFRPNPPPLPLDPPPPPLPSDLFNIPNVLRVDEFLDIDDFNFEFSSGYVLPAPDPPPLREFAGNFITGLIEEFLRQHTQAWQNNLKFI